MFKLFAFSLITTVATAKHDYVRQTKFGTENVAGWLNETQNAVQGKYIDKLNISSVFPHICFFFFFFFFITNHHHRHDCCFFKAESAMQTQSNILVTTKSMRRQSKITLVRDFIFVLLPHVFLFHCFHGTDEQYFYWMFASRDKPSTDPFILCFLFLVSLLKTSCFIFS